MRDLSLDLGHTQMTQDDVILRVNLITFVRPFLQTRSCLQLRGEHILGGVTLQPTIDWNQEIEI